MAEGSAIGRNCASSSLSIRSLNLAYSKPSRSMPLLQHPHLRRGAKYRLSNRQPAQFTFVCDGYLSLCALRITLDKRDKQVARVRIGRRDLSAEPCPSSGRALPRRPSDRNRVRVLRCFAVVGRPTGAQPYGRILCDGSPRGRHLERRTCRTASMVTGYPVVRLASLGLHRAGAVVQPATHNRPVPAVPLTHNRPGPDLRGAAIVHSGFDAANGRALCGLCGCLPQSRLRPGDYGPTGSNEEGCETPSTASPVIECRPAPSFHTELLLRCAARGCTGGRDQ
jgi:hypothetical protein